MDMDVNMLASRVGDIDHWRLLMAIVIVILLLQNYQSLSSVDGDMHDSP